MEKIKELDLPSDHIAEFGDLVKQMHDVDVNMCYQCRKCTSGCPVAEYMDYSPTQVIHAVRLGLKDLVLNSNTYWLCLACGTCTTRCPQETGLLKVMDSLATIAEREGIKSNAPEIAKFYEAGLSNMQFFGKLYDLGVAGMYKLKTGKLTQDIGMGMKMLRKGKLELLPSFQNRGDIRRIYKKVREVEKKSREEGPAA
jgi:heterodisulfide reductase subunit C